MAGDLQPLDQKFPIVTASGTPTEYFIRWAQQKQIDIGEAITLVQLQEYLDAHQIQQGNGIQITPSGSLNDSPTIDADAQEILDQISTTRGTIIYRNASDWVGLAPGAAGQFLKTNGAGADPAWASGGGGAGSVDLVGTTTTLVAGTLQLTGLALGTYSFIEIVAEDIISASTIRPDIQVSVAGSFLAGTNYGYYNRSGAGSGATESDATTGQSTIFLLDGTSTNWQTVTGHACQARMRINNPGGTTQQKQFTYDANNGQGASGVNVWTEGGGRIKNTGAIDGVKLAAGAALTGGRLTIYGYTR